MPLQRRAVAAAALARRKARLTAVVGDVRTPTFTRGSRRDKDSDDQRHITAKADAMAALLPSAVAPHERRRRAGERREIAPHVPARQTLPYERP